MDENVGTHPLGDFDLDSLPIGAGTYGNVYKALNKRTQSTVAIKRSKRQRDSGIEVQGYREIALLKALDHPNVIQLHQAFLAPPESANRRLHLVFDLFETDLCKHFKALREKGSSLPADAARMIARQVLDGVDYLHRNWVMHR